MNLPRLFSFAKRKKKRLNSSTFYLQSASLIDLSSEMFRDTLVKESSPFQRRRITTLWDDDQNENMENENKNEKPMKMKAISTDQLFDLMLYDIETVNTSSYNFKPKISEENNKNPKLNTNIKAIPPLPDAKLTDIKYRRKFVEELKQNLKNKRKNVKAENKNIMIRNSNPTQQNASVNKSSSVNSTNMIEPYPSCNSTRSLDSSGHLLSRIHTNDVRERSRAGLRSALPFTTSSNSGNSSGSSDTQSQGSGGTDSKSDFTIPDGSRKRSPPSSSLSGGSSSTTGQNSKGRDISNLAGERETAALRQEVETLRAEITKSRQTILHMQDKEKRLKERLGEQAHRNALERCMAGTPSGVRLENLNLGERRPSALVRRYAHLYTQSRLDTLDSLDAIPDLRQAEELKAKLLFSVVVLSFRSVSASATNLRDEVRRVLQMTPPPPQDGETIVESQDAHTRGVELAVSSYIAANVDTQDLTKNVEEVCEQIWATLYDYPCLKMCEALLQYSKACIRIAWGLVNQSPPYVLEYDTRTFNPDLHVRFHSANHQNDVIRTYLWPALMEGHTGPCVHQAVVIT